MQNETSPLRSWFEGNIFEKKKEDASIRLSSSQVLLTTKFGRILTWNRTDITPNVIMVNHIIVEHLDTICDDFGT